MPPLALLDTDTLSEIMKGKNASVEKHAGQYLKTHGRFRFSVITRYEILRGRLRGTSTKRDVHKIINSSGKTEEWQEEGKSRN